MRIAVVSDIHGNLTALEAVVADLARQAPDLVLQGGDLPAGGARPAEVADRVRDLGWPGVFGNTDEMLWNAAPLAGLAARLPPMAELWRTIEDTAAWTRQQLGAERLAWLRGLPAELRHGHHRHDRLTLVHASPGNAWAAPAADAAEPELCSTYGALDAAVAVYGHLHVPFVRTIGDAGLGNLGGLGGIGDLGDLGDLGGIGGIGDLRNLIVANSGSAGLPYDGDPRAAYLLVDLPEAPQDGRRGRPQATIQRVEYDLDREAAVILASGLPRAAWVAATLRAARPLPLPPGPC